MLTIEKAYLATVEELFRYKSNPLELEPFPGYSSDQWGIKAHNRPWIVENGNFSKGQKVIEVGGAYSSLTSYLAKKYEVEAWVGDEFGMKSEETIWSRWGNPNELGPKYDNVKYVLKNFGSFSEDYPDNYFDCIFSVSTLEHIPKDNRLAVIKDMNRCLKSGGTQLHTIDLITGPFKNIIKQGLIKKYSLLKMLFGSMENEIDHWINLFLKAGIKLESKLPNPINLLDRRILVESPDVVYRFYPPNNKPKAYSPNTSLLLVIKDK